MWTQKEADGRQKANTTWSEQKGWCETATSARADQSLSHTSESLPGIAMKVELKIPLRFAPINESRYTYSLQGVQVVIKE